MTKAEPFFDENASRALTPVLIVDDSKAQRRLLARTLEKWGYDTVEAASGEEALALCMTNAFDIIISDWLMPGMTGVDFCREFRALSDRPVFILLLTAQTEREKLAEGLESGADDFLSKPFHSVELRARLRAGRRMVQAQRALTEKNQLLSQTLEDLSEAYSAIEKDLKGARIFQEGLVPERHVRFGSLDVSLLFRSSGHVGGDLVGYFPVREGKIVVFSVDVSGHGVASALMTARIAGYLSPTAPERNIALRKVGGGYDLVPLPDVCRQLNRILLSDLESDQYMTMSIAAVDLERGRVDICQAGHPSPAIQHADGTVEFAELWSTPIGLVEDAEFASVSLDLQPGERVLLYTDGLTECPDAFDRLLDEDGLARIMQQHKGVRGRAFVDGLLTSLIAYRSSEEFPDDLSAVALEFR